MVTYHYRISIFQKAFLGEEKLIKKNINDELIGRGKIEYLRIFIERDLLFMENQNYLMINKIVQNLIWVLEFNYWITKNYALST